jgi:hypothetical protein
VKLAEASSTVMSTRRHAAGAAAVAAGRCQIGEQLEDVLIVPLPGSIFHAETCAVVEAVIALSASPNGFTASDIAARVLAAMHNTVPATDYDLKKLRGKHIVCRVGHTRRYQPLAGGLRAITALVVLRDNAVKPLLPPPSHFAPLAALTTAKPVDRHYHALRFAMHGVFNKRGIAARGSTNFLSGFAPNRLMEMYFPFST